MAMFVFVIDTSFMNVSISAVVKDLDTTVSGVQSAVALEALVSAAFILIGSKLGDLFGRKRAYVTGLVLYASGALAMVFAQGLAAIIVFWAVIGGLGASLYLPAMQSLIHGNFEGKMRAKVFAMIGASGAIAAAIGPLIGGFLTTLLSWRVGFALEAVIIAGVLLGSGLIREVPFTGDRSVDVVGSVLSVLAMSLLVLGVLVWQEGGESVGRFSSRGRRSRSRSSGGSAAASARARPRSSTRSLQVQALQLRNPPERPSECRPRRPPHRAAHLPPARSRVQRAGGRALPGAPLTDDVLHRAARGQESRAAAPGSLIRAGFGLLGLGVLAMIPIVPRVDTSLSLVIPLMFCGAGLGLLVSQLNNYTLAPISEERVGEAAGVNSSISSFGLSVGLAFVGAILLAALSIAFTNKTDASDVLPAAEKEQVAQVLEDDAEVMSDARLEEQLAGQPPEIQEEILRINDEARPEALQIALLVPLLATMIGLFLSFRMMRLPDPLPPTAPAGCGSRLRPETRPCAGGLGMLRAKVIRGRSNFQRNA